MLVELNNHRLLSSTCLIPCALQTVYNGVIKGSGVDDPRASVKSEIATLPKFARNDIFSNYDIVSHGPGWLVQDHILIFSFLLRRSSNWARAIL